MNLISLTNDELDDISHVLNRTIALGEVVTDKREYRNGHAPEEAIARLEALNAKVSAELAMRTRMAKRAPDITDLAVSVARQLGSDDFDDLLGTLHDVSRGGAAGGFPGFTYHRETVSFTEQNLPVLMSIAGEEIESIGEATTLSDFIAEFNCVDLSPKEVEAALFSREGDDWTTVANAISWWALEKVASDVIDEGGTIDIARLCGSLEWAAPACVRGDDEDEHQAGVGR